MMLAPVGKALLRIITNLRLQAFRASNQRADSSLCCCVARQRLAWTWFGLQTLVWCGRRKLPHVRCALLTRRIPFSMLSLKSLVVRVAQVRRIREDWGGARAAHGPGASTRRRRASVTTGCTVGTDARVWYGEKGASPWLGLAMPQGAWEVRPVFMTRKRTYVTYVCA